MMSRARDLQKELTESKQLIYELKTEVRMLKMAEKRQDCALSKYEGTHAQLPQVIKSYAVDMHSLQSRLRHNKSSYRKLENRHRIQSTELRVVHKDLKHLLDLTKNKQLGEREKLSNQLEEAENTIKQQEKKIQSLMKKIDLQNKTYRNQITTEMKKTKMLQVDMNNMESLNKKLESNIEKIRYQSFGNRKNNISGGTNHNFQTTSKPNVNSNNSMIESQCDRGRTLISMNSNRTKSHKPKLVHGESEISDHTKDLQKNLMKQIHEDVINKPDMLMNDTLISPLRLDHGIKDIIGVKDLSDDYDENIEEIHEANVDENPFSLSRINKQLLVDNASVDDELLTVEDRNNGMEKQRNPKRLISYNDENDDDDDDENGDGDHNDDNDDSDNDDDVSSISSFSDVFSESD